MAVKSIIQLKALMLMMRVAAAIRKLAMMDVLIAKPPPICTALGYLGRSKGLARRATSLPLR